MGKELEILIGLWPIFIGFITLVVVLAKMHTEIEVLKEKVHTLFEIFNKDDK